MTRSRDCGKYAAVDGLLDHGGTGHSFDGAAALLGREVVDVLDGASAEYVAGETVLVTGAAGSLGAELCVRLVEHGVRGLILVDQAEGALVDLADVLCHEHGFDGAVPVLADLRSTHRTFELLMRYRPRVVFHTAAYKQVPLAEEHVVEAVGTNVLATRWAVEAAVAAEVDLFVLFSTDKAVRPTSVLGQTKAVAEWIVARAGLDSAHTRFASVRLGNVVDSSGSMLPLFRRQIARGGPVTVTHPETTRYLMTAGEAAGLALAAGSCADADGCFWLDLGRPVRILDLAHRVIARSGADVPVAFVGLRPGERMHERFRESGDDAEPTSYPRMLRSTVRTVDGTWLDEQLTLLSQLVEHASADGTRARLAAMHAEAGRETAHRSATVP